MGINRNTPNSYVHTWWDKNDRGNLISMRFLNNPITFNNIDAIVTERIAIPFNNVSLLDIGFGRNHYGGYESSEDLEAIGIYFSGPFNGTSSTAAVSDTLTVKQFVGCGEDLPIESNSFDFICCGDMAVNFMDFGNMIRELSRVLKKDGIFFYDTMNRTGISRFIIIKILQELKGMAIPDSRIISVDRLIRTQDILTLLDEHYLVQRGQCSASSSNFVFHYFNLRDNIPEVFNQSKYFNLPGKQSISHANQIK